jgi:hypothetical protein
MFGIKLDSCCITAGISMEQLLVSVSIIVLTSQGAAKKDAELGR